MQGTCGLPYWAAAYVLNFTATPSAPLTGLAAMPTGQTAPAYSILSAGDGTGYGEQHNHSRIERIDHGGGDRRGRRQRNCLGLFRAITLTGQTVTIGSRSQVEAPEPVTSL